MTQFKEKPSYVNAKQFTGGLEVATELIEWVGMTVGLAVAWSPEVSFRTLPNGTIDPGAAEMLYIAPNSGAQKVKVEDWVVIHSNSHIVVLADETFRDIYEVPA